MAEIAWNITIHDGRRNVSLIDFSESVILMDADGHTVNELNQGSGPGKGREGRAIKEGLTKLGKTKMKLAMGDKPWCECAACNARTLGFTFDAYILLRGARIQTLSRLLLLPLNQSPSPHQPATQYNVQHHTGYRTG